MAGRRESNAVIAVGGKPYKSVSAFSDNRFHLVPVDYFAAAADRLSARDP